MELLKRIMSIVVIGAVTVAAAAMLVSWWQMSPADRSATYALVGRAVAWVAVVAVLPWATWFAVGAAVRHGSNAAGAVLVGGYTLIDLLLLGWVAKWSAPSTTAMIVMLFGGLAALAYNFLVSDWLAERV